MRVCQERARALSVAADNVRAALAATEETLREFDVPRALEARLGGDADAAAAAVRRRAAQLLQELAAQSRKQQLQMLQVKQLQLKLLRLLAVSPRPALAVLQG